MTQIIISIILIVLIHHLYLFFKQNLTTPKIKDLVNKPVNNYNNIYKTINSGSSISNDTDKNEMKNELKQYFKTLNKPSLNSTTSNTNANKTSLKSDSKIENYNTPFVENGTSILETGNSMIGSNNYSTF